MTYNTFKASLLEAAPPEGLPDDLKAMWYAGKENWDASHDIAQEIPTRTGDWIHAYLHRWEGDQWNAQYWYRRAGKEMPTYDLQEEWRIIVETLLSKLTVQHNQEDM